VDTGGTRLFWCYKDSGLREKLCCVGNEKGIGRTVGSNHWSMVQTRGSSRFPERTNRKQTTTKKRKKVEIKIRLKKMGSAGKWEGEGTKGNSQPKKKKRRKNSKKKNFV